ncbi:MAG: hypothetical protein ACRDDH_11765 [Cetobacterium sp.]
MKKERSCYKCRFRTTRGWCVAHDTQALTCRRTCASYLPEEEEKNN